MPQRPEIPFKVRLFFLFVAGVSGFVAGFTAGAGSVLTPILASIISLVYCRASFPNRTARG